MKYAFIILALITMLFSCAKDEDEYFDKLGALTTGTWKLTAYSIDYDLDGVYEVDVFAIYEYCDKDNFYTFLSDSTVILDEGADKCYPGNPQTTTSTWSFLEDQTQLQFEGVNYQIAELSAANLHLTAKVPWNWINHYDMTRTYTKQ